MVQVRVLRPTVIHGEQREKGQVVSVPDATATRLVSEGAVVIVTATPAPQYYTTRIITAKEQ